MKLILLLALGGAHASTRHKTTKNAVDEATTQRLAAEAASASVIKMPGAVAKLFGREEGAEVPAKQAQGPVKQHQDRFKAGSDAPGKVDIYYLGVAGPPADFVLVDTKSGAEHRIPIEAGTHITYDNSVYEHRVDAHPDSKRTMLRRRPQGLVRHRQDPGRRLLLLRQQRLSHNPCRLEAATLSALAGALPLRSRMPLLDGGVHRLTDRRLQGGS